MTISNLFVVQIRVKWYCNESCMETFKSKATAPSNNGLKCWMKFIQQFEFQHFKPAPAGIS